MCAAVSVVVCYGLRGREMVMCAAVRLWFVTGWGQGGKC